MTNFLRTQDKTQNIENAKNILLNIGITYFDFSAYSNTNYGVSVYFNWNGKKVRVSDHSVTNIDRMANELHFQFNVKTLGLGGVIKEKDYQKSNKLRAEKIYNISQN